MIIGNKSFDTASNCYVMGILNVTPDSFSDGGCWDKPDAALKRAEQMLEEGAAIIDIGGESTRPGFQPISDQEEIERVIPILELIKKHLDVPVSIDTYKSPVARAAIASGADMINDIYGLKADQEMAALIAKSGLACCIMHNRQGADYDDFLKDLSLDLKESLEIAHHAEIPKEKIILDPGIGFAKDTKQNLLAMKHLKDMKELGYPVLLGASRKSVIGQVLNLEKEDRLEGTLATSVLAVVQGAAFVRVHDVKENVRAIRMALAVKNADEDRLY